jgi:plastocyanin
MNRTARTALLAMALLMLSGIFAASAKDADQDDDKDAKKVLIQDLKYNPAKIKIRAGETVVWINKDDNDHTVIAKDGSFVSDNLGTGDKFRHTFKEKGEFPYFCKYHPRMKGLVSVSE